MNTKIAFPAMVKEYRLANNLTMEQLAEKIGKTKSTISKWESGTRSPKIYEIEEIAIFFGVHPEVMMFGETSTASPDAKNGTVQAINDKVVQLHPERQEIVLEVATEQLEEQIKANTPQAENKVVSISEKRVEYEVRKRVDKSAPGKVSAGTGYWQEDDYDTIVSFYEDDIPDDDDYDTIAIVVGHSMEPKIKNGDFLFIKYTSQVDTNTIGIFQVNGENYVKKLKDGYLQSLNPDYDNIQLTPNDEIRTIGEVVDVYREG
ncbi:helix-turn-helix domain-containing protein [Streptococcus marmotae]|uniref:helix-turn-helix domain-containing protein n=1 Tax=Streptococcus marmotae TaxID=1825069 RepID=UPI000ACE0BE2|nr:S24 family peptidase [Streptococcus marmotae]QBX16881.1 transcriptional repressor [Streptococcus phage Javan291]